MASATVYRKDYTAPSHWVDTVDLVFDLHPQKTRVRSKLTVRPNEERPGENLILNGRDLGLISVKVNIDGIVFVKWQLHDSM